ncbi:hypothetical protein LIER_17821 [Lithospermum erythrorhizon]|uniref:Uncharacterized protein n=1 Tax=Lithospermum erythrorhizon TaxID=34254 RepID=A0AAV3QF08_LITER
MMKLVMFLIVFAIAEPIHGLNSRKLEDDNTSAPGFDYKCGGCPCNSPCVQSPPPPPPRPPSNKCPPPPPSGGSSNKPSAPTPPSQYVYITGPPGDLYPVDHNYSKAAARGFNVGLQILIGSLLLGFHA